MNLLKTLSDLWHNLMNGGAPPKAQDFGSSGRATRTDDTIAVRTGQDPDNVYQILERASREFLRVRRFRETPGVAFQLNKIEMYLSASRHAICEEYSKLPKQQYLRAASAAIRRSDPGTLFDLSNFHLIETFSSVYSTNARPSDNAFVVVAFDTSKPESTENQVSVVFFGAVVEVSTQPGKSEKSAPVFKYWFGATSDRSNSVNRFPCYIGSGVQCAIKVVGNDFVSELHAVLTLNELGRVCIENHGRSGTWLDSEPDQIVGKRVLPENDGSISFVGPVGAPQITMLGFEVTYPDGVTPRKATLFGAPAPQASAAPQAQPKMVTTAHAPSSTATDAALPSADRTPMGVSPSPGGPLAHETANSKQQIVLHVLLEGGNVGAATTAVHELPHQVVTSETEIYIARSTKEVPYDFIAEVRKGSPKRGGQALNAVFVWASGEAVDMGNGVRATLTANPT